MNQLGIGMTSQRTRQRLIDRLSDQGILNFEVLEQIREIPRHLFIDEALSHRAYEDKSLPIGFGQTISQPYIVAKMTELLIEHGDCETVLEIGTGSGYQTALLSRFFSRVYTTERIEPLQHRAKKIHRTLSIHNVEYYFADGGMGLSRYKPFDAIISTCAPKKIPASLLDELSENGGRLVIPVGDESQMLTLVTRNGSDYSYKEIEPVIFVPLLQGTTK